MNPIETIPDWEYIFSPLQKHIMALLTRLKAMTRDELVLYTKAPRTTIFDACRKLEHHNLLYRTTQSKGTRGREPVLFKLKEAPQHGLN